MIECYFKECMYHYKDEPFCTQERCKATEEQIMDLSAWRREWLEKHAMPKDPQR